MYIKYEFSFNLSLDSSHFNSVISGQNIFSNWHAPSRDIVYNFSVLEHLRSICSGAQFNSLSSKSMCFNLCTVQCHCPTCLFEMNVYVRCGQGLSNLYHSAPVQQFLNCMPAKDLMEEKTIYQPGCLTNVKLFAPKSCICYISKSSFFIQIVAHTWNTIY